MNVTGVHFGIEVSKVGRMLNRNTKQTFILAALFASSALVLSGCRSMPGAGMFGMRSEPSAEALAGNGPTVTYPAPPSATATPEAIASVAGGTATSKPKISSTPSKPTTAQVAGFDVSPGYATQATNMAAAQANGIDSGSNLTKPATFDDPSIDVTKPSSYAFGAKAITPKQDSLASPGSSYALPGSSAVASATAPLTTPSTTSSFAPPPVTSTVATKPVPSATQGFTLPTDSPSFAAIAPPATATGTAISPTNESSTIASIMPPTTATGSEPGPAAAQAPSFSTASAATGYTAPSTTNVLPASFGVDGVTSEGYMPGSTGTNSGYPTGGTTPTTSGSFYR